MKKLLAEYEFKTCYTTVNDMKIAYVKEGKGQTTLLFIHGLSSNSDAWAKNISTLKDTYTCVAVDLPGFGKSGKPEAAYTPTFFATFIRDFIKKLRLKNVVLGGHSMGGHLALKVAALYPQSIEKLILVAPAGLETFSETEARVMKSAITKELVANSDDKQIEHNYQINFHVLPDDALKMIEDRKQIRYASDFDAHCEAIVKSLYGMLDEPVYEDLDDIPHPALVLFGEHDMLIPNRYFHAGQTTEDIANIAVERMENATVEFVAECGHFVQFEKSGEANALIRRFVERP